MMARRHAVWIAGIVVLGAILSISGAAQTAKKEEPWITKDWTTWTAKDCQLVMNSSPWVHQEAGQVSMTARILSALPIRQALLRQLQLDKHYDRMKTQDRLKFDQEHAAGLIGGYENRVVIEMIIHIWEPPPPSGSTDQTDVQFSPGADQVALRRSDGSLVLPTEITVSVDNSFDTRGTKTEYIFPRAIDGRPLYAANATNLVIELGIPLIVDKKTHKAEEKSFQPWGTWGSSYSFKISDLVYKGKLEY
jgi:hypothetical protein